MLLAAGWAVSKVSLVVWVLDIAQVVVLQVVATVFVAVIGCDVEVAVGSSGCGTRGCRFCKGAVGQLGSVYRRSQGAEGCFEAGDEAVMVVVVVDNIVGVIDGGCAGVVSGGVAALEGKGGLVTRAMVAGGSPQACEAMSQVLGSSVDIPASFSRHGGSSLGVVCITASAEVSVV